MRIRAVVAALLLAGALAGLALSWTNYLHDRWIYQAVLQGSESSYTGLLSDQAVRSRALYNLANLYLREAVQEGKVERLRQALAYYREALRVEPDFMEAKKNFELAGRLLAEAERRDAAEALEEIPVPDQGIKPGLVPGALDI